MLFHNGTIILVEAQTEVNRARSTTLDACTRIVKQCMVPRKYIYNQMTVTIPSHNIKPALLALHTSKLN